MNHREVQRRERSRYRSDQLSHLSAPVLALLFLGLFTAVVSLSCSSNRTDLRTLVPADPLVYLETNDLAAALTPIYADAEIKPDLSAMKGVPLAVAVMAFDTSEQKLNEDQSSAEIRPKFVAIMDTHAWHFQAVRFAEEKLGAIVERSYGSKPRVENLERDGGRDITWTAADGRKSYAFVAGGLVYFSNDRSSFDKVLAVRKGATSLASTGTALETPAGSLASGYVSRNGVAQLSDLAGLRLAAAGSEDPDTRSAVALIVPELIRSMVTGITWTATQGNSSVTDVYRVNMPDNVREALNGTSASDMQLALRNAVVGLLAGSKLDNSKRNEVANIIAGSVGADDGTTTVLTPTGLERSTASKTGLIGVLAGLAGN